MTGIVKGMNSREEEEESFEHQAHCQPDQIPYETPQNAFLAATDSKLEAPNPGREVEAVEDRGLSDAPNTENRTSIMETPELGGSLTKATQKPNGENQDSIGGNNAHVKKPRMACLFAKAGIPGLGASCYSQGYATISQLKDHIHRYHVRPRHYCPRCRTVFKEASDLEKHLRQPDTCEIELVTADGITEAEEKRLLMKTRIHLQLATKWYLMWDLLFPQLVRPASPYWEGLVSTILHAFRRHTADKLPTIISERLASELDASQFTDMRTSIDKIVSESLSQIFDQFTPDQYESSARGDPGTVYSAPSSFSEISSKNDYESLGTGDMSSTHQTFTEPVDHEGLETQDASRVADVLSGMNPEAAQSPFTEPLNLEGKSSNASKERSRSTNEIWEKHKDSIRQLYIEENKPLNEVMAKMKEEHGFQAS